MGVAPAALGSNHTGNLIVSSVIPPAPSSTFLVRSSMRAGLFATLLAAYCALLNRYTGQEDLVVCSPFASRDRAELEAMIGYFNNIVVMRADLSADPSFRELMMRVRALGIEAADNQNLPLQRLAELPNLVRVPLTRGMFCYQDLSNRVLDLPGITASPIDLRKETADFDLAMYMQSTAQGSLTGVLEYDAELFDRETIRQFTRDFQTVLRGVSANPHQRLSQLPRFGPQPAEVESHLRRHPQIEQAVVLDLPDRSGSVAYLVLDEYAAVQLAQDYPLGAHEVVAERVGHGRVQVFAVRHELGGGVVFYARKRVVAGEQDLRRAAFDFG